MKCGVVKSKGNDFDEQMEKPRCVTRSTSLRKERKKIRWVFDKKKRVISRCRRMCFRKVEGVFGKKGEIRERRGCGIFLLKNSACNRVREHLRNQRHVENETLHFIYTKMQCSLPPTKC
ncbi:hypothetical protein I3843_01G032400 [Carya illinoinensis]|nr:hypothetical protein I3760_01G033800 [Carya illinoinensis]KAG7993987.1 hypothetical protein I3843_01G032400 [Carya illinoinensis]